MTLLALLLVILSESCSIAGQILFKVAMGEKWGKSGKSAWPMLLAGVGAMALAFFLWLGLLLLWRMLRASIIEAQAD